MRPNESPSIDMLHSVGALMDTSFLRAAVADANGTARASLAPIPFLARVLDWAVRAVPRLVRAVR